MQVVLIKPTSAYDALRIFVDEVAAAFAARGYEPTIIDAAAEEDFAAALEQRVSGRDVALVFSFTIGGEFRDDAGRSIADIAGCPLVVQLVDYPLTGNGRLLNTESTTALLVIDESHVDTINAIHGPDRFASVAFSPHAAISAGAIGEKDFGDRQIPLLFSGTFYKPEAVPWAAMEPNVRKIFDDAADIALGQEWAPALEALDTAMSAAGLNPADFAVFRRQATMIHEYVRHHRRFEFFKAAARIGLPLHCYGSGFEKQLYRFKNITYGGEAPLPKIVELMGDARVVLNVNANFGAGSHERPLTALLAGAAAATDYSRFYDRCFKEGEEIAFYRWRNLEFDLAQIGALAEDPSRAAQLAQAGRKVVLEGHLWPHRIDAILRAAATGRVRAAKQ